MRKTTFFHTFLKRKEKKPFRYTFPNLVSFFRLHRQTRQFNNNFHRCLQRYEKKFEEIFHQEKGNEMYKEGKHRVWKLLRWFPILEIFVIFFLFFRCQRDPHVRKQTYDNFLFQKNPKFFSPNLECESLLVSYIFSILSLFETKNFSLFRGLSFFCNSFSFCRSVSIGIEPKCFSFSFLLFFFFCFAFQLRLASSSSSAAKQWQ